MRNILKSLRSRPWLTAGAVILLAGIVWFAFGRKPEAPPATVKAQRGDLIQEVSVTGKTEPAQTLALSFEKSGRVSRVNAKIGDRVTAGQVLVQLDTAELSAQLRQAQASILSQQARLDQLIRGTRPEEIEVKRTELLKAQQDLANEYVEVVNVLQDAYTKTEDAVRKQIDELFNNDEQISPQLSFTTTNSQNQLSAESGRAQMTKRLSDWQEEIQRLPGLSALGAYDNALANGKTHLEAARSLMIDLAAAVQNAASLSSDTANTYRTSVTTARGNLNTAFSAITAQEQAISSQKLVVQRIQNELDLKLAGTAAEEIAAQNAQVRQAEANAAAIQAQLGKMTLRAPSPGIITRQDAKVGMIAASNVELVSLISESGFEIKTNLPEADVAKVTLGDPAKVTLDAYGPEVELRARVIAIDPAETIVDGVVTYATTLHFDETDSRVKSGMTANIDILTEERKGVIILPQRAVLIEGSERYVLLYRPGSEPERRSVQVGLRGSDGNIEVISGLTEGEEVLRAPETD